MEIFYKVVWVSERLQNIYPDRLKGSRQFESLDVTALGGQSVKVLHWMETFQFGKLFLMQKAQVLVEAQAVLNDAQLPLT